MLAAEVDGAKERASQGPADKDCDPLADGLERDTREELVAYAAERDSSADTAACDDHKDIVGIPVDTAACWAAYVHSKELWEAVPEDIPDKNHAEASFEAKQEFPCLDDERQ